MKILGYLQNATYRLTTSNVKLDTLDAFKGLQIRTMENQNHMAFWSALGAAPLLWPGLRCTSPAERHHRRSGERR